MTRVIYQGPSRPVRFLSSHLPFFRNYRGDKLPSPGALAVETAARLYANSAAVVAASFRRGDRLQILDARLFKIGAQVSF
jgi:hypothetical protein